MGKKANTISVPAFNGAGEQNMSGKYHFVGGRAICDVCGHERPFIYWGGVGPCEYCSGKCRDEKAEETAEKKVIAERKAAIESSKKNFLDY